MIEPTTQGSARYAELTAIYADAYHALAPIYTRLAAFTSLFYYKKVSLPTFIITIGYISDVANG
ncbi:MAG: hypothetical protein R3E79_02410 [Caldilineaceae bacterium]